ncbi:gfo/Idh/MocA family oxidoreductase [Alteromonas sediminis]|uniref:Gfo/Idh/MocA family oxidoreductase n=1 Tax=Alteromonas sediminis TaxID=2259342 RepID=A0A3N5YQ26_9ALTE|nr:Gfo/Idh/MocA family oxidoreductase [Alteromonas sediminis]RPJ68081.1 gfo/Idh/MocA family oxidoreductase [Alteromonas sediminis]
MNFVIVGTNFISDTFLEAANTLSDFHLYGVCSRQRETGQSFLAKHNCEHAKVFTSVEQVCADPNVQCVYIASPNSFHEHQAVMCLSSGKHVLGEKPSAANSRQLENIIKASESNNCLYMEALMTTHLPNFRRIEEAIVKIGKVRKYIGQFSQYSSRYDKHKRGEKVNTFLPDYANGALVDIGIYPLYTAVALFGKPESVLASGLMLDSGVDGAGDLILHYPDKQAVISYSKINNGDNISEIQGELGRIQISGPSLLEQVDLYLNDGTHERLSEQCNDHFMAHEVEHFIALVAAGKTQSPINTFELSRQVIAILDDARAQIGVIYPSDSE